MRHILPIAFHSKRKYMDSTKNGVDKEDTSSNDSQLDPALGHPGDVVEEVDREGVEGSEPDADVIEEVIGVPLMEDEDPVWDCHPSWWIFSPQLALTGVLYGVVGVLLLWVHTPLSFGLPEEARIAFTELYAQIAMMMTQIGVPMSSDVTVPIFVWIVLIALSTIPFIKAYLSYRFTHYVITTHRVMHIESFPGKKKNWIEIENIKSFTSDADFLEQRLKVGRIIFQPANDDPVIFNHIDDYEYWESRVKQIRREKQAEIDS